MRSLAQKLFKPLLAGLPIALIAGLLDYRFHAYFWPRVNPFRVLEGNLMFDFFSVLTVWVMLMLLVFVVSGRWRELRRLPKKFWAVLGLLGLGVFVAVVCFQPVEPQIRSLHTQVLQNYIFPAGISLMGWVGFRKNKTLRSRFERVFLASFGVLALLCLLQFLTGWLPGEARDFLGRLAWPYIDPFVGMGAESANWLAALFGPVVLLSAVRFWEQHDWLSGSVGLLSLAVVGLTQSYTSIGILFLLLLWFGFVHVKKEWRKWVVVAAIVAGILGLFGLSQTSKFQILMGDYHMPNSIERRVQFYNFTWEKFKQRPVEGIGPGNFQSTMRAEQDELIPKSIPENELSPYPHNLLALWWSDLGLFGALALLLIYGSVGWGLLTRLKSEPYLLLAAYPLGHGLADTPYGLEEMSLLFWLCLLLAYSQKK